MIDFILVSTKVSKGCVEIYPRFIVKKSKDLMIRGGDFYAIWIDDEKRWSTDEDDALRLIDQELDKFAAERSDLNGANFRVLHMWDAETGMIDKFHRYCQSQTRDNYHALDEKLIFSNMEGRREDYASKRLPYPLLEAETPAYDRMISTLYSPEERHKIEWAIGAVVNGASKYIQKFLVFYGDPGTGKSTVLDIIQQLFEGYYTPFEAKILGSANAQFALEAFKDNPLVGIQHDGDLSRIEDNTRLNSLVSHEEMIINEKFKSAYANRFKTFLFMGTNKPVKITDSRSGILRRLIDVTPTGERLSLREYNKLKKLIKFELGGIAWHCLKVFEEDPDYYENYTPVRMMDASNDFYNFLFENYLYLEDTEEVTLNEMWDMYKAYCEEAKVSYTLTKRIFKEEMKSYFDEYDAQSKRSKGGVFRGFRSQRFIDDGRGNRANHEGDSRTDVGRDNESDFSNANSGGTRIEKDWICLKKGIASIFDVEGESFPAQYANDDGAPQKKWTNVGTSLHDLDTSKLHYVKLPKNHIVIDFDLKDDDGNKSLALNLQAASEFPQTYVEVSKSGQGLHLHYIYEGDVEALDALYDEHIEIKVFKGGSSLRRMLTLCNDISIATISSGLPLKEVKKNVVNITRVRSENSLRRLVIRNLQKEIHGDTRSSIDFIKKILDEVYESGMPYDISDLKNDVVNFASRATNQSDYCLKKVLEMKFASEEIGEPVCESNDGPLCFFDIEVFPNLFILCWKLQGEEKDVIKMINPDRKLVRDWIVANTRKVGFNNRRYDNHLIYAYAYRNYTNEDIYRMSNQIIKSKTSSAFIGEAYNLSYTDIYDFASAGNKKSLKKLEIEMGIHHQEFPHPWDEPLDESLWDEAADYCCNDVRATEAAFDYLKADFKARLILADIAGMSPNSTTNQLSTRIIFGKEKNPQSEFNYRDLSQPVRDDRSHDFYPLVFDAEGEPNWDGYFADDLPPGFSLKPFFPGYKFEFGKSMYLGEDVGLGGYVYAEPGIHKGVAQLDIASMHPSSILAEVLFGERYTDIFKSIVDLRVDVKHGRIDKASELFEGRLAKYLTTKEDCDDLANALKTVINSVYGLTSASFVNPFKDPRNVDNIVAKRGALFMVKLKHAVQKRGFTVAHIKTDSIKIPNATDEIIKFVQDYGKAFGYTFEFENVYDRMCLVNDAVYIAKYDEFGVRNKGGKHANDWTATGKQFAVPYIFKTLFSHEELDFYDLTETFSVSTALYLDVNEKLMDVTEYEKELKKTDRSIPSSDIRVEFLKEKIAMGHAYIFVGRIGQFTPVKAGVGGGYLYRIGVDKYGDVKYDNVSGASGRRWMETEKLVKLKLEKCIDMSYFDDLVTDAIKAIEKHGSFDEFVA